MIAKLRLWLAAASVVLSALAAMWFAGRRSAKADTKLQTAERDLEVMRRAEEVENEVEALRPDALAARSARWVRDTSK